MPTIRRFEDLNVWQSSRELVKIVYGYTNQGAFQKDFALRDQIRRSVVSVMSNIAEGFGAGSDAEFIRFLGYARRSLCETQSQLYIALDLEYISKKDFDSVYQKTNVTEKQINAFIGYLAKYKTVRIVREESAPYEINIDESIDL
ncbi:MAG: four helix bundle protein [Anaerolineales bacterium]|nr:four helix bundle protein [Anaerolineales bacterium]